MDGAGNREKMYWLCAALTASDVFNDGSSLGVGRVDHKALSLYAP